MDDVVVREEAHDLGDGVGLADVGEELVAQSLALARALDETRDIDELHGRRQRALRIDDLGECLDPGVGDRDDPHVGLDGREGVVGGVGLVAGERVNRVDLPTLGRPTIPIESAT